ncbi:hypothetical protein DRO49_01955 [Candidatus Bathyarchaeota archaeon]|nr:MAG: hypothetical protein DRO49_01955 [Candidatus Bathyarchaeota archaeon]
MPSVKVMTWNPKAVGGREDSFAEGWSAHQVDFNQVDGDYAELTVQAGYTSGYIEKTGISIDASLFKYLALGLWGDGEYYVELYDGTSWLSAISESAPSSYGFKVIDLSAITSAVITAIRLGVSGGEGRRATYDFYEFLSEQPSQPQNLISLRVHQREGGCDSFEGEFYDSSAFTEGHCIRIVVDGVKLFAGIIEEVRLRGGGVVEASGRCFQVKFEKTVDIEFDRAELTGAVKTLVEMFPEVSMSRVKPPSAEGCVGLWHLDEGEGSVAHDSGGYGHDGSINGATWVEGRYGKALSFDGDDTVDCGDIDEVDGVSELSVEVWVRVPVDADGTREFIRKDGVFAHGFGWTAYRPRFWVYFTDIGWQNSGDGPEINDDRWHHIVGVYDGQYIRLYVDGEERSSLNVGSHPVASNSAHVHIGSLSGIGEFMIGEIDEVALYSRALSAEEIWEHYSKGPAPVNISKTYISTPVSDILDQLCSIASKATGKRWSWKLGYGQDLRFRPVDEAPTASTIIQEGVNLLRGVKRGRDLYELANRIIVLSGQVQYPWEDLYCEDVSLWSIEWCGQCTDPKLKNDDDSKEGDYAMMIYDDTLNWWRVGRRIPSIDLTGYKGLRLWVKINGSWSGASGDEITIKFGSDNSNCYYKAVRLGVGNNEWAHIDVDLQRFAKKGNPDLSDVTWIALEAVWPSELYGNVTWDGWHWYAENLKVEVRDPESPVEEERTYVYKDAKLNRLELLQDLAEGLLVGMKAISQRVLLPVIGASDLQRGHLVQVSAPSLGLSGSYLIAEAEHRLNRSEGYVTRVLLENPRLSLPWEIARILERELRLERRGDLEVVL